MVDLEREKFFDRVHQDKLRSRVKERRTDRRGWPLIDRYLKAGALTGDGFEATPEGTPQGGPCRPSSPPLLDSFDKERERRGHRFVRDADESNIYGEKRPSRATRAGQWSPGAENDDGSSRCNAAKSAVDRPWRRTFLGFTCTGRRPHRRRGSDKALKALTAGGPSTHEPDTRRPGRRIGHDAATRPSRGGTRPVALPQPSRRSRSWTPGSGGASAARWWKQWGRRRYRELRKRGVSQDLAWNTCKSAHGPWRLSRSPARAIALPGHAFDRVGVPRLYRRSRH